MILFKLTCWQLARNRRLGTRQNASFCRMRSFWLWDLSLEIAGHFELDSAFSRDLKAFPGGRIASGTSSPFLEGEGTQSGQFDAVTVDQSLCQGGHNGVYGFLSVLSVHVVRFGQIGNKGGFGDGGHGVLPCVLWVSAQKHRRYWRRAQCGCLRARHSDLPDKPIRAAISRSRPRAMALPSSLRAFWQAIASCSIRAVSLSWDSSP